jgi:3-oxoacyl-[acyl-carrier-protein] synthase-3
MGILQRYTGRLVGDPFRGTKARRVARPDESAFKFEMLAAETAIKNANVDRNSIDLLITFSFVRDHSNPSNAAKIAAGLKLKRDVVAFELDGACGTFNYHFAVAAQMLASGRFRNALIVQSSLTSRVVDFNSPSAILVGDGASAAVIGDVPRGLGFIDFALPTFGELHGGLVGLTVERLAAPRASENSLGCGIMKPIDRDAARAAATSFVEMARDCCQPLMRRNRLDGADIDFVISSHPTAWFGELVCEALGTATERTCNVFSEYGHVFPCSIPFNLMRAAALHRLQDGALVLLYCPAAGFALTAVLFRWWSGTGFEAI